MSATESSASPCASQAIIGAFEAPDGARFEGRLCGCKVRLRYLAQRLHALGPRPLFHFIDEIEGATIYAPQRYASLPADFIKANGGDRFAPSLHCIDGGGQL